MRTLWKIVKIAERVLGITLTLLLVLYLGIAFLIGWGVNSASRNAIARFSGDRIESLIAMVDCRSCSLRDRDQAVWALGQLKDKRALAVLYKYRTGKPFNHSTTICQYEIEKAIRWTEGNSYMLPQIWRVMLRQDRRPAGRHFSMNI